MGVAELLSSWPRWLIILGVVVGVVAGIIVLVINLTPHPLSPQADGLETLIKTARAMQKHPLPAQPIHDPKKTSPKRTPHDADAVLKWLQKVYGVKSLTTTVDWYCATQAFMEAQDKRKKFQDNAAQWLVDAQKAAELFHENPQVHRRRLAKVFGHDGPKDWCRWSDTSS